MLRLDKALWRLIDAAILIAVLGMVCLITLQVGSRFFGESVSWTEELSRFLFIWAIWLGLAVGFRKGQHPAVRLLADVPTSRLVRRGLDAVSAVAIVVFFSIVTVHGIGLLRQQLRFGETSATLQIGMWVATLPLVIGAALAVFGAIMNALFPDRGAAGDATDDNNHSFTESAE